MIATAVNQRLVWMRYMYEEYPDKNDDSKLLAAVYGGNHSGSCDESFLQNERQ